MKTILITGANRGLGFELAKQYHSAGWRVIACCRDPEYAEKLRYLSNNTDTLLIIKLDIFKIEEIKNLTTKLANETIDILINNAGVYSDDLSLDDIDPETWLETFKINTIAPVMIAQALISQIARGQDKIIVNISSSMASIDMNRSGDHCIYRTTKAALNAATRCMAMEYKNKSIAVLALDPGWVQTDMGGSGAQITPEKSVNSIRSILELLTLESSGEFISYDGKRLSW